LKVNPTFTFLQAIWPLHASPCDGGWKQWLTMTDLMLWQHHWGGGLCLSILNLAHTNVTLTDLREIALYSVCLQSFATHC
jgi:hypothetical protein